MENEYISNENDVYISSISVNDIQFDELAYAGMRVCGTGLLTVIGCMVILRILRNA